MGEFLEKDKKEEVIQKKIEKEISINVREDLQPRQSETRKCQKKP